MIALADTLTKGLADTSQETYAHIRNEYTSIDTSISTQNSGNTADNPTIQQPHSQSSAYNLPPSSEVPDNSRVDQSSLHRSIVPHIPSSRDNHYSSDAVVAAPRDRFKDWSPAGDWHLQKVFQGHTETVHCLAFSHDGKLLASGSSDGTIIVWNVETCETVLDPLNGHTRLVSAIAFSADNRRIVSGSTDCTVRIWDPQTGEQLLEFKEHKHYILSVAFSSDGSKVVSGAEEDEILIRDVDSGRRVCCLEKFNHCVFNFFFSADDRLLVGTSPNKHTIWDVESGERVPISLQAGSFDDLVWFRNYSLYACMDGEIRRWSQRGVKVVNYETAISLDRKWIAALQVWDSDIYLYSRDPSPEELASVDDIPDRYRRL